MDEQSMVTTSPDYETVKNAIEQSIGWAIEKDFEAMFRLWADNLFHFWVFSSSQVVGLDSFRTYADQWKDPEFRDSLSAADRERLPQHPAGLIELGEAGLSQAVGGGTCQASCRHSYTVRTWRPRA